MGVGSRSPYVVEEQPLIGVGLQLPVRVRAGVGDDRTDARQASRPGWLTRTIRRSSSYTLVLAVRFFCRSAISDHRFGVGSALARRQYLITKVG